MKHFILLAMVVALAACPGSDEPQTACDLFAESVCDVLDYCNQENEPEPGPCEDYFVDVCEITNDLKGEPADPWPALERCMNNLLEETLHCPLDGSDLLEACSDFLRYEG